MNNTDIEMVERAILASRQAVEHKIGEVDARVAALLLRTDVVSAVLALAALAADPKGCAARVQAMDAALQRVAAAQAKLDTDREAHDRKVTAERADLDAREAAVRRSKARPMDADLGAAWATHMRLRSSDWLRGQPGGVA